MSAKQMGLVFDHEFTRSEQPIMLALADHADHDGGSIRPSVGRIAWKTGYSERSVIRILEALRDRKKILVLVRKGGGRGRPNEYRFDWSKARKKEPFTPKKGDTVSPFTEEENPDIEELKGDKSNIKGDIAMSPEPSIEPSSNSRRDADASKSNEEKVNWFNLLTERLKEAKIPISPEDRKRTSRHLKDCVRLYEATPEEMLRVIAHMVGTRLRGYEISPQKALGDLRGVPIVGEHKKSGGKARDSIAVHAQPGDYTKEAYW